MPSVTHFGGLLWTLIRTDFKSRYHGTVGGLVWALLKPLAMFFVLYSVFSFIFASDPKYRLNLLIGLFLFDYFAEASKVGVTSLYAKGYLISKVRFPAWILVATSSSNALIALGVFVGILIAFQWFTGTGPPLWAVALFILYAFSLALMVLGLSLATSVLFLRYRDLNQLWEVIVQAGFFVAPVVYPLSIIPERFHFWLYAWPPTAIIEFSRSVLVAGLIPSSTAHALLGLETAAILLAGISIYRYLAPRAAEFL